MLLEYGIVIEVVVLANMVGNVGKVNLPENC
jgi:hypothetical protein